MGSTSGLVSLSVEEEFEVLHTQNTELIGWKTFQMPSRRLI